MKTTPDKIVRVAEKHITLYTHRVRLGEEVGGIRGKNINVSECKKYLAIWTSIKNKGGQNLTPEEVIEVEDAYDSGNYDDIFKETN
jgi:hypothetical protein